MNVFAGQRIVESYLEGAVGYVNPYGNYIPRASRAICDYIVDGRWEDAKKIQRLINRMQAIINEGHPTYGHQCYSKALASAAGYPVGDVPASSRNLQQTGFGRRRARFRSGSDNGGARYARRRNRKPTGGP